MSSKRAVVALSLSTLLWSGLFFAIPCRAETTWGSVRGRFVWEGKVPPQHLIVTPGQEIPDDSLLVNPENGGIANVAVYLSAAEAIPIHPSYADDEHDEVHVAIHDGRLVPRAAVIRAPQTLVLTNDDGAARNPNGLAIRNPPFNPLLRPGDRARITFSRAEPFPLVVSGNITPWLRGWLVVSDHPYVAITDADGEFEISHLPTGPRTLRVWHERVVRQGYIETATIADEPVRWEKGRLTIDVSPGMRDLGDIRVNSEQFSVRRESDG